MAGLLTACGSSSEESELSSSSDEALSEEAGGEAASLLDGYSSCQQGEDCPLSGYEDLDVSEWYHDGVHFCLENGLLEETDSSFEPGAAFTRAEAVSALYRLEGSPEVEGESSFPDVESGAWYADAAAWAGEAGIVEGCGDGQFDGEDPVTREQLAVLLCRYAEELGADTAASRDLTDYPDGEVAGLWAEEALSWALEEHILYGLPEDSGTVLEPEGECTRAEAASVLLRFACSMDWEEASLYQACYDRILDLEEKYGEAETADDSEQFASTGLCFAELVDFDGDGTEELVTAYAWHENETEESVSVFSSTYQYSQGSEFSAVSAEIKVWSYEDGEMVRIFTGEEYGAHEGSYSPVLITCLEGRYYLIQGYDDAFFGENEIWGLEDGEFVLVREFDYEESGDGTLLYYIEGEEVSEEEYQEEHDRWFDGCSWYYFSGYHPENDRAVDVLYETVDTLQKSLGFRTEEDAE